jgi:hypothetical protein
VRVAEWLAVAWRRNPGRHVVTTSSPESEPHVEHTIVANGIRQGHTSGLVLSQLHIGLAVGFAVVACLTAFGGGMIVGMWYKASEQSAPVSISMTSTSAEPSAQSQETANQPPEAPTPVTFYNTLTNSNVAYAPLIPPATNGPAGGAKGAGAAPPATGTTGGEKAAWAGSTPARGAATSGAAASTKIATVSKVAPSVTGTTRTAAASEAQKHTKATPVAKAAPAETTASSGSPKMTAQKPTAPTRQAGRETGAQPPASATTAAKAPGAEDGSGQPTAVPGQRLRYRVHVGSYTERTAADQTARHLTAQEQVPAIVAGQD